MENKENLPEDNEDALSFRDLPITSDNEDDVVLEPRNSNFEFANAEELHSADPLTETLVFCGEPIAPPRSHGEFVRHPRNGLFIRRDSFKRSHSLRASDGESLAAVNRSSSVRFGPIFGNNRTGSLSTPGRHKAVVGVVRIQSKMEMSDIRKRQSRRRGAPVTMFPAGSCGSGEVEPAVAGHGDKEGVVVEKSGGSGNGHHHHNWGLFKPLRSSAHLVGALTKFGCIPHV